MSSYEEIDKLFILKPITFTITPDLSADKATTPEMLHKKYCEQLEAELMGTLNNAMEEIERFYQLASEVYQNWIDEVLEAIYVPLPVCDEDTLRQALLHISHNLRYRGNGDKIRDYSRDRHNRRLIEIRAQCIYPVENEQQTNNWIRFNTGYIYKYFSGFDSNPYNRSRSMFDSYAPEYLDRDNEW